MTSPISRSIVPALTVAALLGTFASDAHAQRDNKKGDVAGIEETDGEEETAGTVSSDSAEETDDDQQTTAGELARKKSWEFKHYSITGNALSLFLARVSANFEYLPVPHHALIVNPSIWYFIIASIYGAEVGYRFYSGDKGANGFFIGPSLHVHHFVRSFLSDSYDGQTLIGASIDLGGQHIFDNGFTIGGGVGMVYLRTLDSEETLPIPRALFMLGYSF